MSSDAKSSLQCCAPSEPTADAAVPISYFGLTACEAANMIREGRLTAEALARSCLERIAERDGEVRAWSFVDPQHVLTRARELDKWAEKGPLHGIPIGIKDVIDTGDMPTQHNSPSYFGHRPSLDAACVMTLRHAGALIVGKTETVEFAAAGRQPVTRNPHNLDHTPGGSSSGSAAAVADHHIPLSIGTQTGGSTIRAGSFCGIFAMKPTWGLVSREGVKMQSSTLDTVGWYARSVGDLQLVCDLFAIDADHAAEPFTLAQAKIAVCKSPVWDAAEAGTRTAVQKGAKLLQDAGVDVVELELPMEFTKLAEDQVTIQNSEGRVAFLSEYRAHYAGLHPVLRARVENQDHISCDDLREAYDRSARCRVIFEKLCADFDAVLTPSAPGEAPRGFKDTGWDIFNRTWSLLHAPCINVPGFYGPNGLPIGLTLTGPRFADRKLLAVAAEVAACFAGPSTGLTAAKPRGRGPAAAS
jgi:Asp-tRNA(Asn)/Glu-tRNA(Gln) amidotransferase A subunit family amidase